ncbi:MAG TPA: ArsR family transcriptional regulator [Phycisphaerae bacterium]|jgi:hypothetical protein
MAEPARIQPSEARRKVQAGDALLVCAYDDDEKCRQNRLEGAISLNALQAQLPSISKNREMVFYCA